MTTVSCTVMSGGSQMDRATINKQQFVEATGIIGGGVMPDGKVGTNKEVLTIDAWTPADNTYEIDQGHSVKVDLHASDTEELELLFDEGQDFEDNGTHDDTKTVGDVVQLASDSPFIDFEDYVGGSITGGGQPDNWTSVSPYDNMNIDTVREPPNTVVKALYWDDWLGCRNDDAGGSVKDGVMGCRVMFDFATTQAIYLSWGTTGTGSAFRGHYMRFAPDTIYMGFGRWNSGYDGTYGLRNENIGWAPGYDIWYNIKISFYTTVGETTGCNFKIWEDGTAEPESWSWGGNDSWHTVVGHVAVNTQHSSGSPVMYWDDWYLEPSPPVYLTSGEYTSDELDTRAVEHYSHALVTWDEVTPTDTTVAVKARWRPWDAWVACTNGEEIPGIERGDNMEDGSPYENLEFQIALATTDTGATPTVGNLRFYFEPVAAEALLISLDGDIECTVANGLLDYWHRRHVVGGETVLDWDDIKIQTEAGRWVPGRSKAAAIVLKYGGVVIDDIVLNYSWDLWMSSPDFAGYYWGLTPLVYEAAPIQARYNVRDPWTPGSHIYEWVLIDKNLAMHADTWYIVGRPQRDDHPMSWLVAALNIHDHPLSVQPRGWARDDHPLSMLIQGWARNDHPLSVTVGEWTVNDQPVSMLVGIRYLNDHPLSYVVYGVNREGSIVVNVIDDNTHQTLLDHGITFS